jgi:hypothetical protein
MFFTDSGIMPKKNKLESLKVQKVNLLKVQSWLSAAVCCLGLLAKRQPGSWEGLFGDHSNAKPLRLQ